MLPYNCAIFPHGNRQTGFAGFVAGGLGSAKHGSVYALQFNFVKRVLGFLGYHIFPPLSINFGAPFVLSRHIHLSRTYF
jgi:hypothetical protein